MTLPTSDIILNTLLFGSDDKKGKNMDDMNKIELQLFLLFMGLANQQFKYKNMPKEIPEWALEKILNYYGQAVLFKTKAGYAVCNAVNTSSINIYGEPTIVKPVGINGTSFDDVCVRDAIINPNGTDFTIIKKDGVLIKNNMTSTPTYFLIQPFVKRLVFIWQSLGINEGLSRIKCLIYANKDASTTIKNAIRSILGSSDLIPVVGEKNNFLEQLQAIDLKVTYTPDIYWADFDKTFQFILQMVGISANAMEKKERLTTSEAESNSEVTTLAEDTRLDFRKKACEEIKELFGLDVKVDNKVSSIKIKKPTMQDKE